MRSGVDSQMFVSAFPPAAALLSLAAYAVVFGFSVGADGAFEFVPVEGVRSAPSCVPT